MLAPAFKVSKVTHSYCELIILELTRRIEDEASKTETCVADEEHQRRLEELENDKFMTAKRCNSVDQTVHDLEVKIQQTKLQIKRLLEEKQQAHQESTVEVPKIKYIGSVIVILTW